MLLDALFLRTHKPFFVHGQKSSKSPGFEWEKKRGRQNVCEKKEKTSMV